MAKTEEIIDILKYSDDVIIEIQVMPAVFVRVCYLNDIDPRRPYRLIVHPPAKQKSLRVQITSVTKTQNRAISKALERTRVSFARGFVGLIPEVRWPSGTRTTTSHQHNL